MSPTTVGTAAAAASPAPSAQLCSLLGWKRGGMRAPSQIRHPRPKTQQENAQKKWNLKGAKGSPSCPSFLKQTWVWSNVIPLWKCVPGAPPRFWAHCYLPKGKPEGGDHKPLPVRGGLLPPIWTMRLVLVVGSGAKWLVCTTQPHPWRDRNAKQSVCQKKQHP